MMLLGVILQIIIFTLLATIIALPTAGIVLWCSKQRKTRNTLLAFLSPFVFLYSIYFGGLIGGFVCATIFDTGCGMDGYYHTTLPNGYEIETIADDFDREYFTGTISKDEVPVVTQVKKIKIIEDTVYGEFYYVSEAQGSEYYFSLNTRTNELTQYTSYDEAQKSDPVTVTELTHLEPFYYKSWKWVIPLAILTLIIASGLVFLMFFIVKKITK